MIKKQTVKWFLSALILFGGVSLTLLPQNVSAETKCGGVTTSIIACDETGVCEGGERPFEGKEPVTDAEKISYKAQYKHDYGKCEDGSTPDGIESTGVWAVLLLAINILTAGIGLAAVAGIVYGSILYTSAGGSQEQIKKAMGIFTNVVIGVVAYALMYVALNFLIPGGVFR